MIFMPMYDRPRNRYRKLLLVGILGLLFWGFATPGDAQTESKNVDVDKLAQFLQEADELFRQQNFLHSFQLYRNVLALEPKHRHARKQIYEIAHIYQTLEQIAIEQGNQEQAALLHQTYRKVVRYLLTLLTKQLQSTFTIYEGDLGISTPDTVAKEAKIAVLEDLLHTLQELQAIYEQFPQKDTNSAQMVERLTTTISKYQEELAIYRNSEE